MTNSKLIADKNFKDLEKMLIESEIFTQPKKTLIEIQGKVSKEFDLMVERLLELKSRRLKELENVFGIQTSEATKINKLIKKTKENMYNFIDSTKGFYCFNEVEDTDNFTFLSIYDFLNECNVINKSYMELVVNIKSQFRRFENLINTKFFNKIQLVLLIFIKIASLNISKEYN